MEKHLAKINATLRGLVVSTPIEMNLKRLLVDYKNYMGEEMPIHRFGYTDPVKFLRERCQESFQVGRQQNPILILILNEELVGIDKIVKQHELPPKVKESQRRTSIPPPKRNLDPPKAECSQVMPTPEQIEKDKLDRIISVDLRGFTRVVPVPVATWEANGTHKYCGFLSVKEFLKSVQKIQKLPPTIQLLSKLCNVKKQQLELLHKRILDVLDECIFCESTPNELVEAYRKQYNCDMNFAPFGFRNVVEAASVVECLKVVIEADGSWNIIDLRESLRARNQSPSRLCLTPSLSDNEDQLSKVQVYDEDCLSLAEAVTNHELAGIQVGSLLPIILGEVYSPSHFWIVPLDINYNIITRKISRDIRNYFDEVLDHHLDRHAVHVGQYCLVVYMRDWHRVVINKVFEYHGVKSKRVQVRFIDDGRLLCVSLEDLRQLPRCFATIPAQAIRARLADVRPPCGARRWPVPSTAQFKFLTKHTKFVASVEYIDEKEQILEVLLLDIFDQTNQCISRDLVHEGFAERRVDSAIGSSESYLLPNFEDIESGATLNFEEIFIKQRQGVDLNTIEEFSGYVNVDRAPTAPALPTDYPHPSLQPGQYRAPPKPVPNMSSRFDPEPSFPMLYNLAAAQQFVDTLPAKALRTFMMMFAANPEFALSYLNFFSTGLSPSPGPSTSRQ